MEVFSLGGIRAHVLDTITPFLNDRTAHYLGLLSDHALVATWTTLTRNAKGETKEKFSIDVTNRHGARHFIGLSGGEKRKVRLACAFALHDLATMRSASSIKLFVADEIDDALDQVGLERLMTVLTDKARQCGTVLVISHNDLRDWIPHGLTVRKEGGFSVVEQ